MKKVIIVLKINYSLLNNILIKEELSSSLEKEVELLEEYLVETLKVLSRGYTIKVDTEIKGELKERINTLEDNISSIINTISRFEGKIRDI